MATAVMTKGNSGPIAKLDRTTKDSMRQGWIAGIGLLQNISGMDIPAGITKGEAGEELTDAKLP